MKTILFIFVQILIIASLAGQQFEMDTIVHNGSTDKYINFVIIGDGYTSTEQNKFIQDAKNLSTYLFTQAPFSNYKNFFNVFAIKVISNESGADHANDAPDCNAANPKVPVSDPDTYFGCKFDSYGIHRLVVPTNFANIYSVMNSNFPNYDQLIIIANSPYYGGSGGAYATLTANISSNEVGVHELGHSFAGLADEYYAGDQYFFEKPNMTQTTSTDSVKWKNWLGHSGIGIHQYCCGGASNKWYKPHTNCKMQYLGPEFCSVCKQTIIERIHTLVNPIVDFHPLQGQVAAIEDTLNFRLTRLMKPIPNTLNIDWILDGKNIGHNVDSVQIVQSDLLQSNTELSVLVTDTSQLLRVNGHETIHFNKLSWLINKLNTNTEIVSEENEIELQLFPNPVKDVLNLHLKFKKEEIISVSITSLNGTYLESIINQKTADRHIKKQIDVSHLHQGNYLLNITIGKGIKHSSLFVKE